MIIDVHALHPLPPSNVNRDKEGQPKTCLFGGVTRHSVSSASWKHRTKDVIEDRLLAEGKQDRALRTRRAAPAEPLGRTAMTRP